ncbi:MAG: nitroreductase family protein [Clostridia bacterium]|nr:nitroreductase family protein [Clostridia bacterium]
MEGILDLIRSRQSTRAYTGEHISEDQLLNILEAGRLSPSARNTQPWKFYATRDSKLLTELSASFDSIGRNLFVKNASAVIAITEEPLPDGIEMRRRYAEYDIGMAILQMCLEAESVGVASCILGTYNEDDVKRIFDIPAEKTVAMVICLGISADSAVRPKNRKDCDEVFVIR